VKAGNGTDGSSGVGGKGADRVRRVRRRLLCGVEVEVREYVCVHGWVRESEGACSGRADMVTCPPQGG